MRTVLLLWIFIQTSEIIRGQACPLHCFCKRVGPQAEGLKAKCESRLQDIKEVDINGISAALVQLDLSKNEILVIESGVFKNLTNLKRLDLSSNKISSLDEGCFEGLDNLERLVLNRNQIAAIDSHAFRHVPNLKRLDLSTNKLSAVEPTLFHNLLAIDRLKLNQNVLTTLKEGTFHGLKTLKQLDLSGNPWDCNCNIYWFSSWVYNTSIKLSPAPKCSTPPSLRGQPLKKLRLSEGLHCHWTTPAIEMLPDQNQVVFAGDSIKLKCRAPSITEDKNAKLNWLWNPNTTDIVDLTEYTDPLTTLSNLKVENRYLSDSGIVDSSLSIGPVEEEHTGQWSCQLLSLPGNRSKAISVIVISDETRYCPLTVTRNNKGIYAWPRTVIGWKVELPCEGSRLTEPPLRATYRCNMTGQWGDLRTESCPYMSHITKVLEQFSKVNLSLTKGRLLETAKSLRNHTGDGSKLTDPVEISFIARTIENYLNFLVEEKELGSMLIDIISAVMNVPREILRIAEVMYNSCSSMVNAVENITKLTPGIQSHKKNMAVEEHRLRRESFTGLTCTWYSSKVPTVQPDSKTLHCATNNRTMLRNTKDNVIEASIQLPASLLMHLEGKAVAPQLMIAVYSDSSLFPKVSNNDSRDISSCIIGSKLIGLAMTNLSEPVYVMLKAPMYHYTGSRPKPVVWDASINDTGGWTSDGCHLSHLVNNLIVFYCNRLGYYGLLQDTSFIRETDGRLTGAKFRPSHPAIYIGSFVAIACLTCISVTYMICHASILMPKKVKHCVVNTWIAMALLCFLYSAGIQQTENIEICQGVGVVLHYLSLCSLLWMAVSASNMYKRLSKSEVDSIPEDEIPEQPIQKPLLGLYLVGWGIALIICGISGAVNLREYAGYAHCFLSSGPALAAFVIPAVILIVYLTIFHLLIRGAIRNVDSTAQLSEGTQGTENMDLELLEPNANPTIDRTSTHSTQTIASELEDLEHSQMTQLKGQIMVLVLYLTTWTSAAFATIKPLKPHLPYEETIFSVFYALSASVLGMFILLFYGIARSDVRSQWLRMRCWLKKRRNRCCRTRSVSDRSPIRPAQPLVQSLAPVSTSQATQVCSDTNSRDSSRHTGKSRNSNVVKAAALAVDGAPGTAQASVNLVVLHRQQYRSNNSVTTYTEPTPASVEMFYNPHQSGVARKFFKKQRRYMKNNNLGPRKQGDGGATSDGGSCRSIPRPARNNMEKSIFGPGAKVNNTNFHVELNPVSDLKNVNILSDSGGSVSEDINRPRRFLRYQENLGQTIKKINNGVTRDVESPPCSAEIIGNRHKQQYTNTSLNNDSENDGTRCDEEKHLRNVSQQCSLEYSSEVESQDRSDYNLPERGETPEEMNENFLCAREMQRSDLEEQEPATVLRSPKRLNHSASLSCLPINLTRLVGTYRSSLNDVASMTSSRTGEYSRPSMIDLQSVASSPLYDRVHTSQKTSSFASDTASDLGKAQVSTAYIVGGDAEAERILSLRNRELHLQNLNRGSGDLMESDFTSMTNLPPRRNSLSSNNSRHLAMNASIGLAYEDTSLSNAQRYMDDDMFLENGAAHSSKKETSV